MIDRFIAGFLLVLLFPLMVVIFILIKIDSSGKAIYKQERVGKNGRKFIIYKFKSMTEELNGPVITTSYNDKRITRVGKFLRKTSLDELPQLLNIFKGDMSFVGPRPERTYFHNKNLAIAGWKRRLEVAPGLTGLAQIKNEDAHNPRKKLKYDLEYADKKSFWLDIKILSETIKDLFSRL